MNKKWTDFRSWVNSAYYDAMKERFFHGQQSLTVGEFWTRYKYWLKQQYKNGKN
jgi:hypothetical protein